MKIKKLLPIGSVVKLSGKQKTMILGIKVKNFKTSEIFDYIAVLYPEGYVGPLGFLFFNHEEIKEVVFTGYEDEERDEFIKSLTDIYSKKESKEEKIDG